MKHEFYHSTATFGARQRGEIFGRRQFLQQRLVTSFEVMWTQVMATEGKLYVYMYE